MKNFLSFIHLFAELGNSINYLNKKPCRFLLLFIFLIVRLSNRKQLFMINSCTLFLSNWNLIQNVLNSVKLGILAWQFYGRFKKRTDVILDWLCRSIEWHKSSPNCLLVENSLLWFLNFYCPKKQQTHKSYLLFIGKKSTMITRLFYYLITLL